jgi:hypothetical protein
MRIVTRGAIFRVEACPFNAGSVVSFLYKQKPRGSNPGCYDSISRKYCFNSIEYEGSINDSISGSYLAPWREYAFIIAVHRPKIIRNDAFPNGDAR